MYFRVFTTGIHGLTGDEECTWQVFEGGGNVSITCLATAGSRGVAVGGTGGCLEIWDVEMACSGGLGAGGGRPGLVHRLVRVSTIVVLIIENRDIL